MGGDRKEVQEVFSSKFYISRHKINASHPGVSDASVRNFIDLGFRRNLQDREMDEFHKFMELLYRQTLTE